jgi:hypothetical protein
MSSFVVPKFDLPAPVSAAPATTGITDLSSAKVSRAEGQIDTCELSGAAMEISLPPADPRDTVELSSAATSPTDRRIAEEEQRIADGRVAVAQAREHWMQTGLPAAFAGLLAPAMRALLRDPEKIRSEARVTPVLGAELSGGKYESGQELHQPQKPPHWNEKKS